MLDMHPPFQIDGNFGGGAGICEALVQSHSGELHVLPAVPKEWESGSVRGVIARGGFEVGFDWESGRITKMTVHSKCGNTCAVVGSGMSVSCGGNTVDIVDNGDTVKFDTESGRTYEIKF